MERLGRQVKRNAQEKSKRRKARRWERNSQERSKSVNCKRWKAKEVERNGEEKRRVKDGKPGCGKEMAKRRKHQKMESEEGQKEMPK
jgi:hypothetical protein